MSRHIIWSIVCLVLSAPTVYADFASRTAARGVRGLPRDTKAWICLLGAPLLLLGGVWLLKIWRSFDQTSVRLYTLGAGLLITSLGAAGAVAGFMILTGR